MLNERQNKEAELYAKGEKVTDIAKLCGVSRQCVYDDMKRPEFKAKVDECLAEAKTAVENKINNDVELYCDALKKIALTGKSEKNRLDALSYLLNRIYGTPTNKTQDITENKDGTNINTDELSNEFEEFKDIKLKKVK